MEGSNRREELFYTRALVKGKSAVVVIDERSSTSYASTYMVEKMELPTIPHDKPYRIQGPSESEGFEVTRQAYVSFSIGRFEEIELYDVVPMRSCHLLLGNPWKTLRKGSYDESRNRYKVRCQGRWMFLAPSTPQQAMEDRLHVRQTHERWEALKEEAARKARELKAEKERLEKEEVIEPTWIKEFEYTWLGESERVTKEDVSEPIVETVSDSMESTVDDLPFLEVVVCEEFVEPRVEQKQGNPIEDGVQDDGRVEEPLEITVVDHEAKRKEFLELLSRRYIQKEEFLEFLPSLKGLTIEVPDLRTNPFQERESDMIPRGVTSIDLVLKVRDQRMVIKDGSKLMNPVSIECIQALDDPFTCIRLKKLQNNENAGIGAAKGRYSGQAGGQRQNENVMLEAGFSALRGLISSHDRKVKRCPIELKFCGDISNPLKFNVNGGDWIWSCLAFSDFRVSVQEERELLNLPYWKKIQDFPT